LPIRSFQFFLLAVFMHACVFLLFTFTFRVSNVPAKPAFVFLGSFLRQQDVALPPAVQSGGQAALDLRQLRLDSSQGAWPHSVGKPSLTLKAMPQEKNQYKPLVAEDIMPSRSGRADASDLGIEFEPPPAVKLEIEGQ
jgi:hypothetical protein